MTGNIADPIQKGILGITRPIGGIIGKPLGAIIGTVADGVEGGQCAKPWLKSRVLICYTCQRLGTLETSTNTIKMVTR